MILFDGWYLNESSLTISKDTIFGYKEITINLKEIEKIIYSESGYRKPPYLIIHYKSKKVFLYINYSIFDFADTLKFFKRSGIDVSLSERDVEIEMYLNDKVDKIPITNE